MEKQRIKSDAESFGRLLKKSAALFIFFCLFSKFFAQSVISQSQLDNIIVRPSAEQNFYTKSDIKFEVIIPNTTVNSVMLQNSSTPKNVTMRTMRKTQEYGDEAGAKIEIWFLFDKKGEYKLPPLSLLIGNRKRTIQFEPITVTDNPEFLSPRIVLVFLDDNYFYSDEPFDSKNPVFTGQVGQKVPFTVCLQYAVLLVHFDWELPVDSIFSCTKNYEILETKYRERRVSEDLIPVADFEWTALAAGEKPFPQIKITATSYNGSRVNLQLPEFSVDFLSSEFSAEQEDEESFFDRSFALFDSLQKIGGSDDEGNRESARKIRISDADCELLAALRHKERTELFSWKKNVSERSEFEANLGITTSINEFNVGLYYFSAFVLLVCIILFVIFTLKRKVLTSILLCIFMIFSLFFFIFVSIQKGKIYGISKGARITSIPEDTAKVESKIGEGLRVQIVEEAGSWIYVQMGETGGWCKKTDVVYIE